MCATSPPSSPSSCCCSPGPSRRWYQQAGARRRGRRGRGRAWPSPCSTSSSRVRTPPVQLQGSPPPGGRPGPPRGHHPLRPGQRPSSNVVTYYSPKVKVGSAHRDTHHRAGHTVFIVTSPILMDATDRSVLQRRPWATSTAATSTRPDTGSSPTSRCGCTDDHRRTWPCGTDDVRREIPVEISAERWASIDRRLRILLPIGACRSPSGTCLWLLVPQRVGNPVPLRSPDHRADLQLPPGHRLHVDGLAAPAAPTLPGADRTAARRRRLHSRVQRAARGGGTGRGRGRRHPRRRGERLSCWTTPAGPSSPIWPSEWGARYIHRDRQHRGQGRQPEPRPGFRRGPVRGRLRLRPRSRSPLPRGHAGRDGGSRRRRGADAPVLLQRPHRPSWRRRPPPNRISSSVPSAGARTPSGR